MFGSPLFQAVGRLLPVLLLAAQADCAADLLSPAQKKEAVEAVARVYETRYVYPETGKKMADLIRRKAGSGQYDAVTSGRDLGRQITEDLQGICADRHVMVFHDPEGIRRRGNADPARLAAEDLQASRRRNFGFKEVRRLEGNIGYLKITSFDGSEEAFAAAAAAMQFLANCDALILDVRTNPGGDSAMVQFLASYFLPGSPVLLDEFHFREKGRVEQLWSLPHVPGKRLAQADLYILIDRLTFSAAEGLAYDLQALKRAVICGETSVGGGHAVETATVLDRFLLYIPVAYSRNPVTKSNFQGKGVQPDLPFNGEAALPRTHLAAIEQWRKKTRDERVLADLDRVSREIKNQIAAIEQAKKK